MIARLTKLASRLLPRNQFARSVSILAGGTATSQLLTIGATPLLSRLYTPADFGLLALFGVVSGIVATAITLRYETAILLPKRDEEAIDVVILSLILALVFGLVVSIVTWVMPEKFKEIIGISSLGNWLPISILSAIGGALIATTTGWLNRNGAYNKIAKLRIIQTAAAVFVSIVLGLAGLSSGQIIAQLIGIFVGLILIAFHLSPLLKRTNVNILYQTANLHKAAPKFLLPSALLDVVTTGLPVLMIGAWFNSESAGQFSLAWRILALPMSLIGGAISQVFFQRFSGCWPNVSASRQLLFKTWLVLFLLGLFPMVAVLAYGGEIFVLILGEAWRGAGELAGTLAPMLFVMLISSPTSSAFLVLGLQKYSLYFGISFLVYRVFCIFIGITLNDLLFGLRLWVCIEIIVIIVYNAVIVQRMK